jgi:hypothetical protein
MKFRDFIREDFNQTKAVKDALTWLNDKYGKDMYKFKYIDGMVINGTKSKTYDINVGDNVYQLNLRKFDSNGDGISDTVGFDVQPVAIPKETKDKENKDL